jgi:hypothetical protein
MLCFLDLPSTNLADLDCRRAGSQHDQITFCPYESSNDCCKTDWLAAAHRFYPTAARLSWSWRPI